jgi:DNA-directed RNA polymerase subunit L
MQTASYRREHPWAAKLCVAVKTKKDIILKQNIIDFFGKETTGLDRLLYFQMTF